MRPAPRHGRTTPAHLSHCPGAPGGRVPGRFRQGRRAHRQGTVNSPSDQHKQVVRRMHDGPGLRVGDAGRVRGARPPGRGSGPPREGLSVGDVLPALGQLLALVVLLVATVPALARYLAHVYTSERHLGVERAAYRVLRVDPDADQHWRSYMMSILGFSLVGVLVLYAFGRLQQHLPLSLGFSALPPDGAWNTAVSFVTNWQWYSGEAALGHLVQMSGLTVQNFLSAAVGMAAAPPVHPPPSRRRWVINPSPTQTG